MRRSFAGLVVCAIVVGTAMAGASPAAATGADPTLPGCTGGVATNPSVDQTASKGGAPTGYTFVPASPVPAGTPGGKQPKLYTDNTYTHDGSVYALISTPDGKLSEAYQDIKPAIPGAVYDLSVWAGTHETSQDNLVGLRFLDVGGKVIGNFTKDVTHDVDTDKKLGRENLYGVVAPPGTTTVRFFAATNYNWVKWDCVYLRVSAYTIQKEVQDTASGQWMDADGDPASPGSNDSKPAVIPPGNNANYRITVKNTGSEPLSAIQVTDAWCSTGLDTAAFTLNAGASKQFTCVHNGITQADEGHINTATASGAKYWNGVLPNKSETARIVLAPPPPRDKLGDFVWVDNNRDGVQGPDEPGVAGVLVTLKDEKGTAVAQKTTGPDGKYLFEALKDASYQACFELKQLPAKYTGYLPTKVDADGDDTRDSDVDPATGCTPVTALGPNKPTDLTLDAGIRPPNRLGDYAWIDDNKDGQQTAGEPPAPGVIVILKGDKGTELSRTTTKPDGKYLFDGLRDDGYQVCFDLSGLPDYQVTKPDTGDPGSADGTDSDADPGTKCAKPTTLNAENPEDLTLDIGLIKPVNRVGDLVWVDTNGNGLQDANEPGVPDVPVSVKGTQASTMKTGPDGKYLFDNLPDGNYQVCFDLKQLPAKYADYLLTNPNAGPDAADSDADTTGCTRTVALGPGKRENLTLDVGIKAPPNQLGDFVWVDSNKNGQQDNDEPAVAGVPVTLKGGATTTTGPNGKYLFDNLPDGEYQVCFDRAKLPKVFADYVFTKPRTGDATKDSDADPETGCTLPTKLGVGHRADLTLDAGIAPPANRIGDFVWVDKNKNGQQDANEAGVPDVPVTLEGASQASTKTGPDGKYLFDSLPDGDFKVCFGVKSLPDAVKDYALTKPNAGDDGKDSDADAAGCTPTVKLGTGNRENLTLDAGLVAPPNRIGDFVWVDKNSNGLQDNSEPGVPNVPVKLKNTDLGTKTGPDGKYVFDNVPDGSYQVCFGLAAVPGEFAGYMPTKPNAGDDGLDSDADLATGCTPPVTVGVGKRENLTLDLGLVAPANRLGDYVWYDKNSNGLQDTYESGVEDLTVVLQDGKGTELARTKTDAKGLYLFDRLADGTYRVCFDNAKLTRVNTGDDAKDSDADPTTGCTGPTTLGPNRRVDLTLDAGFLPVPKRGLSSTGFSVIGPIMLGSVLLVAGGVLLFVFSRRRRRT